MAKAMNEVDAGRDRRGLFQCKRLEVKGVKGLEEEVCVCVCVCVLTYRHGVIQWDGARGSGDTGGGRERERALLGTMIQKGGLGRRPRTDSASPRAFLLPPTPLAE